MCYLLKYHKQTTIVTTVSLIKFPFHIIRDALINGKDVNWAYDHVNGMFSDYLYDEFTYDVTLKFSQAADLIESFNWLGFHDVCNVLSKSEVTYIDSDRAPFVPYFEWGNASGTFY